MGVALLNRNVFLISFSHFPSINHVGLTGKIQITWFGLTLFWWADLFFSEFSYSQEYIANKINPLMEFWQIYEYYISINQCCLYFFKSKWSIMIAINKMVFAFSVSHFLIGDVPTSQYFWLIAFFLWSTLSCLPFCANMGGARKLQ